MNQRDDTVFDKQYRQDELESIIDLLHFTELEKIFQHKYLALVSIIVDISHADYPRDTWRKLNCVQKVRFILLLYHCEKLNSGSYITSWN